MCKIFKLIISEMTDIVHKSDFGMKKIIPYNMNFQYVNLSFTWNGAYKLSTFIILPVFGSLYNRGL